MVSETVAVTSVVVGEGHGSNGEDFVDFCGLGGPLPDSGRPAAPGGPLTALAAEEFSHVSSGSAFGDELGRLYAQDPGGVINTRLHLAAWLSELSQSSRPRQAAHAYWAVSRGLRFLPRNHQRSTTHSANYFKHEHASVVQSEFDRLRSRGFYGAQCLKGYRAQPR